MNKVIITVLAACAVIGAVWILCADCHAEDYAEQMVQAVLDGDDEAGHAAEVARATKLEQATMIFGVDYMVREHMDAKVERLKERLR